MVTSNALLYLAVLCCLSSIQGLKEMLRNITASRDMSSLIEQAAAKNDTNSTEFAAILDYFVLLTVYENEVRNEVVRLTKIEITGEDDVENIYGSLDWQNAINDVLQEPNVTTEFNKTIEESVVKYIERYLNKPGGLKERYQQTPLNTRRDNEDDDHLHKIFSAEASIEKSKKDNEFWDTTDVMETRRIYGGNWTRIKYFPFMASVHIFNRFSCAGSIISSDLVITAASCLQLAWNNRFFRENPAFLSVRIGSHFFNVGGEVIPVLEVFFHPTYVPRTLVNNLAIMRLERVIKFKRKRYSYVKKIDFDRRESALPFNTPGITIVGWGAKTHANKIYNAMVNRIHIAELDIYDLESCREVYGKKFVTRTNFCAGFISTGEGACNLDVGDPGISGRLLMGVTSFGSPVCGRADTPTVFTKLGYYTDWIEAVMEQDVPRAKAKTTSRKPFTLDKVIKLFVDEYEIGPIPPLRDGYNLSKTGEGDPPNGEPGIPPILDTDPEYDEFETTKHIQRSRENEDFKVPIISAQSIENIKKELSMTRQDDADIDVNARTRFTKAFNLNSKGSVSIEADKADEEDYKISVASDHNKEYGLESELDSGTVKMVTGMGIVEPNDDILDETNRKSPKTNKKYPNEVDNKSIESEADEALRQKLFTPNILQDNAFHKEAAKTHLSKKKHMESKRNKKSKHKNKRHSTTPSEDNVRYTPSSRELIAFGPVEHQNDSTSPGDDNVSYKPSSGELIEFGPVEHEKDSLKNIYTSSQSNDIQEHDDHQPELQPEMEKMLEHEINKLISQLEFSDEESSVRKNHKLTNITNVHNAKENKAKGENNEDVWTLLYISDNEKKQENEEQGLNIDIAPFTNQPDKGSRSNTPSKNNNTFNLIDKSEIYQIFEEVMNTVVNKTSHY